GVTFELYDPLTLNLNNCLFSDVQYPIESQYETMTVNANNCTFDGALYLYDQTYSYGGEDYFNATNSIFSNITNNFALVSGATLASNGAYNAFYNATAFGAATTSLSSSPYESS